LNPVPMIPSSAKDKGRLNPGKRGWAPRLNGILEERDRELRPRPGGGGAERIPVESLQAGWRRSRRESDNIGRFVRARQGSQNTYVVVIVGNGRWIRSAVPGFSVRKGSEIKTRGAFERHVSGHHQYQDEGPQENEPPAPENGAARGSRPRLAIRMIVHLLMTLAEPPAPVNGLLKRREEEITL
jgi:hypothetical protein